MPEHSLVLAGGRVIDPESGLDAVRDVGIDGDRVAAVSAEPLTGRIRLDVSGLVVCPGFVDLHSHGQAVPEQRLQALDGVTTALELEAGTVPVAAAYARAEATGRPINFGYSTSWALARMAELAGVPADGTTARLLRHLGDPRWQADASPAQRSAILARLRADLDDGALGIGVLAGYAPGLDPAEYLAVAALAAEAGVPTYTHARPLVELDPGVPVDGAEEIVRAAGETGAHMHYCHVNSTSARHVDRVLGLVERLRAQGGTVSTEAYPYGAGSTAIGAAFLAPERLGFGLTPRSLTYLPTGERIADADRLRRLREQDPGGLVFVHVLDEDEPADVEFLRRALLFADTAVASDAMPLTWTAGGPPDPMAWPLPAGAVGHPRGAGTFAKALRLLALDGGPLSLPAAIARCTTVPARVLRAAVPAMARKGRIGPGSDADVVVFDPTRLADRATYTDGTLPSAGIVHVLVNGTAVVRDGEIVPGVLPGRAVRR